MNFFEKLLGKGTTSDTVPPEAKQLLDAFYKDYGSKWHVPNVSDLESVKNILAASDETRSDIIRIGLTKLTGYPSGCNALEHDSLSQLMKPLLKKANILSDDEIVALFTAGTKNSNPCAVPWDSLLKLAERYAQRGMTENLIHALVECQKVLGTVAADGWPEFRKYEYRAIVLAGNDPDRPLTLNGYEAWGARAVSDIKTLPVEQQKAWRAVIEHAIVCSGTTPSAKWTKTSAQLLEKLGEECFIEHVSTWFPLLGVKGTHDVPEYRLYERETISVASTEILKGLAWMCVSYDDPRIAAALGDAAEACFKKVPNVGPRCPKVGNACVAVLSNLKSKEAIAQLGRLKGRVKHASSRTQIEKAMNNAANKAGLTVQDLEELNVPTYGFQEVGRLEHDFGEHKGVIEVSGSDVELKWTKEGKPQKSVPAHVKQDHKAELKTLKKTHAEVEKLIQTLRFRIESSLIEQRSWTYKAFKARYLDHPIAATMARRLIWSFNGKPGIWVDGEIIDVTGCGIALSDDMRVELWHPISSDPEGVLAWRQFLRGHEITQPFKQAHREIYVLTDAERTTETYSNRFAAHIIRQHQFAQLCAQRAWRYKLQGAFDSHNIPHLVLERWDLVVQFLVEPSADAQSPTGIYLYCSTDQVRFHTLAGATVPLAQIMPIVFTEVMRDVDLFVGVCSIGTDPTWRDTGDGHDAYWERFSFGELSATAQTRKIVLQDILPALKIAPRCEITDKWLIVRGDIRTYKIHLGSGNIMMEPNNQYLCIVPERGTRGGTEQRLYLPFEGDGLLSIILSKAFLLAEDKKIKDPTITRQIGQ